MTLLFITLLILLLLSVPVGFAIGISTFVFMLAQGYPPMTIVPQRMLEGVDSFPLMALPLFILSGELMGTSCTPRLMRLANLIVGKVPGGLGAATSVGCGFFGAISGSGVATTAAIGGVMAPEMIKNGYGAGFTASLVSGAGVLGMVIPPSFCMVVYGAAGGVSIGKMFFAGIIPGLMAVLALVLYSIFLGRTRHYYGVHEALSFREKLKIVKDALLPLVMPIIILGGVLTGIVTPTESAMLAVLYALVLELFFYKALTPKLLVSICVNSAISSAIILFIISAATPFGWLMATNNVPQVMAQAILQITQTTWVIYLLLMLLLLVLGTFMEGTSVIILLTPIILPIVTSLGVDPVHFGIVMMMAIAIGGVTPPLAVSLFISCRIVNIRVEDTFPDVLYVIAILVAVLVLLTCIPEISLWLPSIMAR